MVVYRSIQAVVKIQYPNSMKIWYVAALMLLASCAKEVDNNALLSEPIEPLPPKPVPQLNYYISTSGSAGNSGRTADQSWSLEKANDYTFHPGDTINIVGVLNGSLLFN